MSEEGRRPLQAAHAIRELRRSGRGQTPAPEPDANGGSRSAWRHTGSHAKRPVFVDVHDANGAWNRRARSVRGPRGAAGVDASRLTRGDPAVRGVPLHQRPGRVDRPAQGSRHERQRPRNRSSPPTGSSDESHSTTGRTLDWLAKAQLQPQGQGDRARVPPRHLAHRGSTGRPAALDTHERDLMAMAARHAPMDGLVCSVVHCSAGGPSSSPP